MQAALHVLVAGGVVPPQFFTNWMRSVTVEWIRTRKRTTRKLYRLLCPSDLPLAILKFFLPTGEPLPYGVISKIVLLFCSRLLILFAWNKIAVWPN